MKQALLYSINAEHLANILNGLKTIEVRKRDLPQWAKDKLARGEKVIGYGYCTKGKPLLVNDYQKYPINGTWMKKDNFRLVKSTDYLPILNGLVVVKFEVSGSDLIAYHKKNPDIIMEDNYYFYKNYTYYNVQHMLDNMCLEHQQVLDYGKGKDLYAHHLKNIQPVNMELGEFYNDCGRIDTDEHGREIGWHDVGISQLTKVPQSFQTVWVKS